MNHQQKRIMLLLVITITATATITTNQLIFASSSSDDEMMKDIEETQKETEQLKKCMEANYELDYCDKSSLIK